MIINEQKLHLTKIVHPPRVNQIKKFNSKGYFYNIEPYDHEYLKKKHQAYQRYHDADNKQNFVYNLSQKRMKIGYYEMKGCRLTDQPVNNRRRVLKTINNENERLSKISQSNISNQKGKDISESLLKRYIKRRQKLRTRSQRSLTSVFAQIKSNRQSIGQNSQQRSQMSFNKESEGSSTRIMLLGGNVNNKIQIRKILSTHLTRNSCQEEMGMGMGMGVGCKEKLGYRRSRLKTIE